MNADPENFDALLQVLALKKYEQPPPGYFNRLPGQILARLEKEETGFWNKIFSGLVVRPTLAYSLGLAFCGAFATGVFYAFQLPTGATGNEPVASHAWEYTASSELASQRQPASLHVAGFNLESSNEVAHPLPSLFGDSDLRAMPVSYTH